MVASPEPLKEEVAEDKPAEPKESKETPKREKDLAKVGRRVSARVTGFFKSAPKAKDEPTTPKVDENPPMIAEPTAVAPLEEPVPAAASEPISEPTPAVKSEV